MRQNQTTIMRKAHHHNTKKLITEVATKSGYLTNLIKFSINTSSLPILVTFMGQRYILQNNLTSSEVFYVAVYDNAIFFGKFS